MYPITTCPTCSPTYPVGHPRSHLLITDHIRFASVRSSSARNCLHAATASATAASRPVETAPFLAQRLAGSLASRGGLSRAAHSGGALGTSHCVEPLCPRECCGAAVSQARRKSCPYRALQHPSNTPGISREVDARGCCPLDRLPLTRAMLRRVDLQVQPDPSTRHCSG